MAGGFLFFISTICIHLLKNTFELLEGAGGEVANARVCKTCIRGFNSRPALQLSIETNRRSAMSNRISSPRKALQLDVYAVALALALALLVRFNVLPAIKW
jgi:hypothetical protein